MEGRREKRNPVRSQVLVSNLARSWLSEQVSTENITHYGMRVQTERPWEPGTIVHIKSFQDELRARARVVYCQPLPGKRFGLGLEFLARTGARITR